jgi:ABC-type transporter Mla subunit MlaD
VFRFFGGSLSLDPAAERLLGRLITALNRNSDVGEKLMTAIDDLTAADTALGAEIAAVLTGLQTLGNEIATLVAELAAANAVNNTAAIAAIAADLTAKTANLSAGLATALATIPAASAPVAA